MNLSGYVQTTSQGWLYRSVLECMFLWHDALGLIPGTTTSQRSEHTIALQIFHIMWTRVAHPGD